MSILQASAGAAVVAAGRSRRSYSMPKPAHSGWTRARHRGRSGLKAQSVASRFSFDSSLCSSCAFSETCTYARRGNKPVLHCEEHA